MKIEAGTKIKFRATGVTATVEKITIDSDAIMGTIEATIHFGELKEAINGNKQPLPITMAKLAHYLRQQTLYVV